MKKWLYVIVFIVQQTFQVSPPSQGGEVYSIYQEQTKIDTIITATFDRSMLQQYQEAVIFVDSVLVEF